MFQPNKSMFGSVSFTISLLGVGGRSGSIFNLISFVWTSPVPEFVMNLVSRNVAESPVRASPTTSYLVS
jgi:hypothetical protein